MRRLGRYIFNGLTVLSLLLCVATLGLWVRSMWVTDGLQTPLINPILSIWSQRGRVALYETYSQRNPAGWLYNKLPATASLGFDSMGESPYATGYWHFAGFAGGSKNFEGSNNPSALIIPYWFIFLLTALAPVVVVSRKRLKLKFPDNHCQSCGYDLRATPDRCPECGNVPPQPIKPST